MSDDTTKTELTVVEINGVKMEVDLRRARIIHEKIQIGSKVKILVKNDYSAPEVYPGIVVGFDAFDDMPTINVAYLKSGYLSAELCFAAINSKSAKNYSIVPSYDDELPVNKGSVLESFSRAIDKHKREIEDIEAKRNYFNRLFGVYFRDVAEESAIKE